MDKEKIMKFREDFLKQLDDDSARVRPIITENFVALCRIAEAINEQTRIETPQGTFMYHPNPKFAYEKQ